ncbi:histone-lysine N-methyltransferase ASHR1 isoform X3 [Cucumis melo var. makuwa]|uniref:Histone-lysine N-methyltransferase ASHR1 isoform X3 n=1 Tax=Cucumis melo var. makuwa TaxID=1194695 RepID=A0A5D3CZF1_CUCMM|nr:histone-lysine N-methyltransferase ASHR1 isoform X3 [Cucumis melo var. makuwa]TYK17097.1 histone-lysine N-methyltransferase ASHR1 isoform X3 [Cucumis melo var. makuwa]
MVQTRIEEHMEMFDQEIVGMKKKITGDLSYMETNAKERSMMSDRMTKSTLRESSTMKSKENEATSNREIGETRTEKKKLIRTTFREIEANLKKWRCRFSPKKIPTPGCSEQRGIFKYIN